MRQGEEMDGEHTGPFLEGVRTNRKKRNKAADLPEDSKAEIPEPEQTEEKKHQKDTKRIKVPAGLHQA